MLTLYTKERLSRPQLSTVEEGQIAPSVVQKPTALQVLATLRPGELVFDDEDSGSDITDPFSDIQNSNNISKGMDQTRKRLTRFEQNLQLMQSFSKDFKKAMDDTRKELKLESQIYYEDMEQINKTLEEAKNMKGLSNSMEEKLNKIFRDEEYLKCGPDLDIPDPEPNTEEAEKEYDVMSGVWKMLQTSNELIISPPEYDAFRQQTPHWLEREGVSWEVVDKARHKCEGWLETQIDEKLIN